MNDSGQAPTNRAEAILASQMKLLRTLATGGQQQELLTALVSDAERFWPGTLGSVLLYDKTRNVLRHCVGPNLPDFYIDAIDCLEPGPNIGSCGAAAFTGKMVIVDDIETHPNWAPFRDVALRAGLRASWSHPILSASNEVLGTFAMYYREPKAPGSDEINFIRSTADIAAIAIEKTQTQAALVESEQRFKDFAHAAGDRMWETDTEHRFSFISGELAFGPSSENLIGMRRWELPGLVEDPAYWEEHQKILSRQEPFRGSRFQMQLENGDRRHVELNGIPFYDSAGQWCGYRGTATDVTTEVEAMETARAAREHLALAVENFAELFTLCDADDRIVIANRAWRELNKAILDRSKIGDPYSSHLRAALDAGLFPEAAGHEEDWLAQRLERRRTSQRPFELERQDGVWLLVNDERLPDGSVITISLDITERKHTETALRIARDRAEAANQTKLQFLATMSHELRTPLNAIIGYSDLIQLSADKPIEPGKLVGHAQAIKEAGKHLLDLINDILDVSKIEAGKFTVSEDLIDIQQLIGAAVRLVRERAGAMGITLDVADTSGLPGLKADSRRSKQMLLNLLANAIEHTPTGGTVRISAHLSANNNGILIEVSDTGIGIAADDIPKVLQPFVQLDTGLGRHRTGTGLGLALTRELAELHGGTLELKSTIGEGTCARIAFPAHRLITENA